MTNFFIKVNDVKYPSDVPEGITSDVRWDGRETKSFRLTLTYNEAMEIFVDDVQWSIVMETIDDETQEKSVEEFENFEFSLAGDVTDHRDGTVTIKMGEMTDLEEAYELLYGEV